VSFLLSLSFFISREQKFIFLYVRCVLSDCSHVNHVTLVTMSSVSVWFIIETVHFILGSIGCIFKADTVIQSYSLKPNPISSQAVEMVHVLAAFYVQNTVICGLSIRNEIFSHYTSLILFIFYYSCLLYDIYDILFIMWNRGENGYPLNYPGYRWLDTFIHLIFGVIHTIYFAKGRY
jgi:hypothetical protein